MLLYQLGSRKQFALWGQIVICVSILHLFLLLLIFFIRGYKSVHRITIGSTMHAMPVIFLPGNHNKKSNVRALAPSTTAAKIATKHPKKQRANKKGAVQKNRIKAKTVKEEKKTIVPEVKQTKKVLPEKKTLEPALQRPVKNEPVRKVEQVASQQQLEPVYVTATEAEQLIVENYLREEIGNRWRPPQGLSEDLSCEIKFVVSKSGVVDHFDLVRSSGVLLYDLAAENLFLSLKTLPGFASGKEFFITLKQ